MDRVSPKVLSRTVDDEEVLLDLSSQAYYGLNPVATRIWHLVRRGLPQEQVAQAVAREYEVELPQARLDLQEFLRDLRARGLLRSAG